ncbi:SPFH domain-containing protein [Melioribacter sp. OK-6-Me]|uniref:SPFH domain-containing protein n=1 Tax=unclassified Melioribacter TaxID=2627329 RepID=UPI003EDA9F9C
MEKVVEKNGFKINGYLMVLIYLALLLITLLVIGSYARHPEEEKLLAFILLAIVDVIYPLGFIIIQPNESKVLILFGKYTGTVKNSGFWWVNPLSVKKKVSLRIHNFNSDVIKVNDLDGNPIEIAAVIVWRVVDSARAIFDVQNYEQFVAIQSETAIRTLATEYSYDSGDENIMSLRTSQNEISERLKTHIQQRLEIAGVEILEARISHLAYAPEIAQAMLRRQQAQAVVAARQKIVEGAVGMVDMALKTLSQQQIVQLDEDKKATMVNNLMVALVSEVQAQPVINTGTLYQ